MSEMGELADATIKKDKEAIVDAVGDVMVCLVNYCALQDLNLVDCMEVAYDQIKNRRGTLLPNGLFVKESS
jgi:NTP pyrophosphatase (non-canonical NTP hydrolase)